MSCISVIMPNYNHAPFLKERLDSILAQDYPDFEVILLDDASTDDSVAILKQYTKHPKVKMLIEGKTNSGNTFVQWERGLKQATGDYIWIAESDDVAQPSLLTTLVAAIEQNDAVLAFCASHKIDETGAVVYRNNDHQWQHDFCMDGADFVRQYLLGYSHICNASAVVFRRDAAENVEMAEVQQYSASGDRLFWAQLAMNGKVAYVAQPLNGFRQHTHKVSGSAENQGINMQQDHAIYGRFKDRLGLTHRERQLICGYHWQAIHKATVSAEGRQKAIEAWGTEKEFNRASYGRYMVHRLMEKTRLLSA